MFHSAFSDRSLRRELRIFFGWCLVLWSTAAVFGQDAAPNESEPKPVVHQIVGLSCPERVADLQKMFAERLTKIELVDVDFAQSQARFRYDPAVAFPGAKPEQIVERFDKDLRNASRSTFGVKPLRTTPLEELTRIEIPIAGLDCKACCHAVYEMVYRLPGVEQATASFKDGKLTVWAAPDTITAAEIEAVLSAKGVPLPERKTPE